MSESKGKPSKPSSPPTSRKDEPGRLETDDRGNVGWKWSDDEELQADDSLGATERMRALVDPNLDVQEEEDLSPIHHDSKALKKGYDPYQSGALGKNSWKKKKDLRQLSKWIQLKRKMDVKNKKDEG
jgi:hypothetical protein